MLHRETVSESSLDLLIRLGGRPELGAFALAGGTSLALRFGRRLSVDLVFFQEAFENEALTEFLKREFAFDRRRSLPTGVAGFVKGVRVDFVKYRYPLVEAFEVRQGARLMSLPDVVAMKLSAVTNRGAKKDFYDLHELIARLGLPKLMAFYQAKFPGTDPMMLARCLTYFEDAETQEDPVSLKGQSWPGVKAGMAAAVRKMMLTG